MKLALLSIFLALPALAQVTAVVSPQGTDPITQTTGYKPKTASLARLDICNAGDATAISSGSVTAAVILQEQYGIYGSDVVNAVLTVLQSKDVFTRAQKIIQAGANTSTLITALFRTISPLGISIIQAAPAIAAAILPAVGDPRDLAALGGKLLQDNSTLALGKKGGGAECKTILVVVMTAGVKIDTVRVE